MDVLSNPTLGRHGSGHVMINPARPETDRHPASSGRPLDAVVFARLMSAFAPFEDNPTLAVGVSGGADSMALTLLADEWCRERGGSVLAITVDHGLRAAAAQEARWVGQQLAERGIDHVIMPWQGEKPKGAVQEQARIARYELLDRVLEQHGIWHLLVAHHAGDQAETIAMREARGSKPMGRAGITARRYLRHGRVLRPLLPVCKADLVATLQACGQEWIEDPSNTNPAFERVRVRGRLAGSTADRGRHAGHVHAHVRERIDLERAIGMLLARAVTIHANGVAMVRWDEFGDATCRDVRNARIYGLGQVVRTVGGARYMPAFEALGDALDRLDRDRTARISLGGCILHGRKGQVCVYREIGRMDRNRVELTAGKVSVSSPLRWDNRFELFLSGDENLARQGLWIGALDLCDVFHTKAFRTALREIVPFIGNLPRAALASMPALYDKEDVLSIGGLEVSELSDLLSAASCKTSRGRGEFAFGGRWRFAPRAPLWESGFKSSPKPDSLLAQAGQMTI